MAIDAERGELLGESVVGEEPTRQTLTDAEHEFERLSGLNGPDDAGEHAEHSRLGAVGGELRWRWLGEQTPVARAAIGIEDGHLSLPTEYRPVDDGHPQVERRVVHQVPGGE